jgi:hypothetical protein
MSTEYSPLPDFLEGLKSSGHYDSEGSLTIDKQRAARLTAKFRLQSPYQYILKLIQAAVACGATEIAVKVRKKRVEMVFPQPLCTLVQWQQFLSSREEDRDSLTGHLKDFDVGLNALAALEPRRIMVASWDGEEGFRHHEYQGQTQCDVIKSGRERPQTKIVIERTMRFQGFQQMSPFRSALYSFTSKDLFDVYAQVRANRDSEYSQVWYKCCFAPIPIILNGLAVNRPAFGEPKSHAKLERTSRELRLTPAIPFYAERQIAIVHATELSLDCVPVPTFFKGRKKVLAKTRFWFQLRAIGSGLSGPLSARADSSFFETEVTAPVETFPLPIRLEGGSGLVAGFAILARVRRGIFVKENGWLCFVRKGIIVERVETKKTPLEAWRIICLASHLKTDLTGFQIVRDEQFQRLWEQLVSVTERVSK